MKHNTIICRRNAWFVSRVLAFALPILAMAQTTINIKDLRGDGLTLIPSTDATFEARSAALLGTPSAADAPFIPYSVILTNSTAKTVRAYALQWSFIDKSGATNGKVHLEQNFDPSQSGTEIAPGGARQLSPQGLVAGSATNLAYTKFFDSPNDLARLSNQVSITVSLDSVAFEDGKVIGPNESFAIKVWSQMYAAQHDVAASALNQYEKGGPLDSVVAWLQAGSNKRESHPPGSSAYELLGGESHWYQVYAQMTFHRLLEFSSRSTVDMLAEARRLAQIPVPVLTR